MTRHDKGNDHTKSGQVPSAETIPDPTCDDDDDDELHVKSQLRQAQSSRLT